MRRQAAAAPDTGQRPRVTNQGETGDGSTGTTPAAEAHLAMAPFGPTPGVARGMFPSGGPTPGIAPAAGGVAPWPARAAPRTGAAARDARTRPGPRARAAPARRAPVRERRASRACPRT